MAELFLSNGDPVVDHIDEVLISFADKHTEHLDPRNAHSRLSNLKKTLLPDVLSETTFQVLRYGRWSKIYLLQDFEKII